MAAARLVLAGLVLGGGARRSGPVLGWYGRSSLWPPLADSYEGHVVGAAQLSALLAPALDRGPRNVVLFCRRSSAWRISRHMGASSETSPTAPFPNLESALAGAPSTLVLPAVQGVAAAGVLRLLKEKLGLSPLHVEPGTLRELRLNASLPALLLVRLPYTASSSLMAPKEVLMSNDEIIGQVLSALKEDDVPYTALLTAGAPHEFSGMSPGWPQRGEPPAAAEANPSTSAAPPGAVPPDRGAPDPLLGPEISPWSGTTVGRPDTPTFGAEASVNVSGSSWSASDSWLVLKYANVLGSPLTATFHMTSRWFPVSGQDWFQLSHLELATPSARPTVFNASQVTAPATMPGARPPQQHAGLWCWPSAHSPAPAGGCCSRMYSCRGST
ncbi:LOW QUALITY PROTEIN: V-type proton ATPase subunit S1 [Dermochelys coriacea]|uniref:LOW QUALITY PROTEIN: V-type proton ATPase subunit S1 n=1 Tax=Dermochelys coriacea TaxID=27794 RepID=UPI001CA8E4DF|nr:LOW QUALITY PROTEIN: V-type proton ATPase subunit S1 [Dermochelys coriacea]